MGLAVIVELQVVDATGTPLWRNGPPEKPVLCNACGSRWRTKGSLTNYTPLHAREAIESEEFKYTKVKSVSLKVKEQKLYKKKLSNGAAENEYETTYSDQNFRKVLEVDTSNRSSSGSAISYSESCAHFSATDASDLTGSAQSNVWDSQVPSKKRTGVTRPKPSSVEKLTKDLYSIMHEQQSSNLSVSSEEDLLYESGTPLGSFEIGHGGVLIRYPNPKTVDEESEASSLPIDNKSYLVNEAYSGSASFPVNSESKGTSLSNVGIEELKKAPGQMAHEHLKRNKLSPDRLHILRNKDSPLKFIDLKDVVTFDVFVKHMTQEEQQRLMKYLPSIDTAKAPESLKAVLHSTQFEETLSYYQQLLQEGIFDHSLLGANIEECRTLKRLVLQNLTRSRWVEVYKQLKDVKCKEIMGGKGIATEPNFRGNLNLTSLKRSRDSQNQNFADLKGTMRSPKRVCKSGIGANPPPITSSQLNSSNAVSKAIYAEDFVDNEGACFSPGSLFASPPDRSSMLVSLHFSDEVSSDQDLLLDVPCNAASFPEAELLYHPWHQKTAVPSNSPAESGVVGENSLSNYQSSNFSCQLPRQHR